MLKADYRSVVDSDAVARITPSLSNNKSKRKAAYGNRGMRKVWEDSAGNVFHYTIDELDTVSISKCDVHSTRVCIPEALDACKVVSLDESSFANQTILETIEFPSTLLSIGRHAFDGCIRLGNVQLPDSLSIIGEEAFFNCSSMKSLRIPPSVTHIGSNLTGARTPVRGINPIGITIDKENENLFASEDCVIYERCDKGLIAVDGSLFTGRTLNLDKNTIAIVDNAFASSRNLGSVVFPEGLKSIGNGAFRGCTWLHEAKLPQSLEHVGKAAFSCTALKELFIPAGCVDVAPRAFEINPVIDGVEPKASGSSLVKISVDPDNPLFTMVGDVLCRRLTDGSLEAVVCTKSAREICLNSRVSCIAPGAFCCTSKAQILRVSEGAKWNYEGCLLAHENCEQVEIEFKAPRNGMNSIWLETPKASAGRSFMKAAFSSGRVDVDTVIESYDAAVLEERDDLSQARHIAARLANPICLSIQAARSFKDILEKELKSACVQFGARNYWQGFDHLLDAEIINEKNISEIISVLTHFGDAPSVAYLLELKRSRFGKAAWDFDL